MAVVDAAGEPRELHLTVEEGGLRVVVFHRTEHALIPVNDGQAQELALWLAKRVGFPPGEIAYSQGQVFDHRPPT